MQGGDCGLPCPLSQSIVAYSLALHPTKGKPLQSTTCPLPQSYKTLSVDDLEKIRGRECNLYFKRLKFFVLCLLPSSLALKGQKATKSAANKSIASVILDSFAILRILIRPRSPAVIVPSRCRCMLVLKEKKKKVLRLCVTFFNFQLQT